MRFSGSLRVLTLAVLAYTCATAHAQSQPVEFSALFDAQVSRKADLTPDDVQRYRTLLTTALTGHATDARPEFYLLVDRNPEAQKMSLFVGTPDHFEFIGASPVATGARGRFDYYITPLGVFEHKLRVDFRAEGSRNGHGIRGYGSKGMRVWDFGWFPATKGWKPAKGETGDIRFQMHATDPGVLEPKLGRPGSKGCVRIPESLNKFLDRYGALDAAYEEDTQKTGKAPRVWAKDRVQTPFSGRFIVVVDSSVVPDTTAALTK